MNRKVLSFDFSQEAYQYIMDNSFLRESEKIILNKIIEGKTVKELADEYNCSQITICRTRKRLYEKTSILMNYAKKDGDIDKYYKENIKIPKKPKTKLSELKGYKVYILIFPNDKVYIGMTHQEEKNRWLDGKGYTFNERMYEDIINYGWKNISKKTIYKNLTKEEALEKEKELIIHYKSNLKKHGYNKNY